MTLLVSCCAANSSCAPSRPRGWMANMSSSAMSPRAWRQATLSFGFRVQQAMLGQLGCPLGVKLRSVVPLCPACFLSVPVIQQSLQLVLWLSALWSSIFLTSAFWPAYQQCSVCTPQRCSARSPLPLCILVDKRARSQAQLCVCGIAGCEKD